MRKHLAKQVLVVDDEQDVRRALTKILHKEGFDVETAADGVEALALAERKAFDLVITDVVMPRCGGRELLVRLHSTDPAIKIILITSYGDWDAYVDAMNAGAFDYITKPIKKTEIVRIARHALAGPEDWEAGGEMGYRGGLVS